MSLAHFGLVALLFAIVMLPRILAIHFGTTGNLEPAEYDHR